MLRFESQKTDMLKANPREFLKCFQVNADVEPFIYGCYRRPHAKVINMSRALLNARTTYPFSYNKEVKVDGLSMTALHNWLNSIMDWGAIEPTYPFGVNTRGMFLC
jgi:hypothetical protein